MADDNDAARRAVPAELRRRVLVEAGHRCAIPSCRHLDVEIHHIVEWSQKREHEYSNLIALCPNCHNQVHKGKIDRKSLYLYKANLRFIHDKFSHIEIDLLFDLYERAPGARVKWPQMMVVLLRRIQEAGFIHVVAAPPGGFMISGVEMSPGSVALTDAGRAFVASLSDHEI